MKTITVFSWGYYGWGNHTPQLVKAVDAVETSRGFNPLAFVDIRIRRSVRAAGFNGSRFADLLGQDRYKWMDSLGNKFIESRTGASIQIAEPRAANELLDFAIDAATNKQRLLYFCSCRWPKCNNGKTNCHRTTVARLLLKAGQKRQIRIEVVEWPGGTPKRIDINLTAVDFAAVRNGRTTVPLGKRIDLAALAGLPWGSIATLHSGGEKLHRAVGPAIAQTSGWVLPVMYGFPDPTTGLNTYKQKATELKKEWGLDALLS